MAEEKAKKSMNPALKQSVIAIAVLVIICLVCVLLLALCNDLLYVSPEEKFNRTIRKVYSGYNSSVTFKEEELDPNFKSNSSFGEVLAVRSASDGSYVVTSKGTVGAFGGGSVTILVAIGPNPDSKILGWALQDNEGQTFIANITEKHQQTWFVGSLVSDVQPNVSPNAGQGKGSGATYTENALANAINMACYYCQNVYDLGANPLGDAKKAASKWLTEEGYSFADTDFEQFSGQTAVGTALDGANDKLKYILLVEDEDGVIFVYTFGEDDAIKVVAVKDGEVIVTSDNVTGEEDFVQNIVNKPIQVIDVTADVKLYTFISNTEASGETQVYTVTGITLAGWDPGNYTLTVSIVTDGVKGKVTDIKLTADGNGFAPGRPSETKANILIEKLVGATSATIDELYNDKKESGATQSANIIMAAVKAALTHYDANFASND